MPTPDAGESKTLTEHLGAIRSVVLRSLVAIGIGSAASFAVVSQIFKIIIRPYASALEAGHGASGLLSLSPSDTFMMSMQVALACGTVIAFPYVARQIWGFVSPGLFESERRFIVPAFLVGLAFFVLGTLFSYFAVLPGALRFFRLYSLDLGVWPAWTVSSYVSFATTLLLAFGVAFELPVVVVFLVWLGVVTPAALASGRRYAILGIVILSAILTPPDIVSLCVMAVPLIALFEVSIVASKAVAGFRRSKGVGVPHENQDLAVCEKK